MVTDLQAILDPSVPKPSTLTARHAAAVDDEDFFDQPEFCDDKINNDTDG